ncbi:MAG: hypothetical protein HQL14_00045 [Candidatus Omnitrophica bacterium]|nr:hypothetical protein [Candidatus Omnitrophota bacterium]
MKTRLSIVLAGGLLLFQTATVSAASLTSAQITLSALIPAASSLSLTVTPVDASTDVFGTPVVGASTIAFGTLAYKPALGIYLPASYYAVDIGTNGAGTPSVTVTYTEGANGNPGNPNGGTSTAALGGLGTKTTATFVTEAQSISGTAVTTVESTTSLGKKRLIDLTGTAGTLSSSSIPAGSWERVYIGVWSGSSKSPADPSNGKPFSTSDAGGTYTGTLTFSATIP